MYLELHETQTIVTVHAHDKLTVVEVGEILVWLAIACRSSKYLDRIDYSSPCFSVKTENDSLEIQLESTEYELEFSLSLDRDDCWHRIFKNPTICDGYPIQPRKNNEKGLQVALDVVSMLACAQRAVTYGDILLLKGISSLLMPVRIPIPRTLLNSLISGATIAQTALSLNPVDQSRDLLMAWRQICVPSASIGC